MKTTYILRQNTRSSEFGTNHIEKYINCLNIGFGQFDFIVMNGQTNKMLVYESYELDNVQNTSELLELLKTIYQKHDCLPAGFWQKIIVNYSTAKHALIPESFYNSENGSAFLKLNVKLDETSETTQSILLSNQNAVSSFAFPENIKNWLSEVYPNNLVLTHDIASFISGLEKIEIKPTDKDLFVLLKKNHLHITVFQNGKIAFANSFTCKTVNDFTYYLLLVAKELNLNRSETTVKMYGTANDRSAFYVETQKYFAKVSLGREPANIEFTTDTDKFPANASFELLGAYLLGK